MATFDGIAPLAGFTHDVCPCCACPEGKWERRNAPEGIDAFDCACGAMHYRSAGKLETVPAKQRRSAQRAYASQLASVRDAFNGEDTPDA